MKWPKTEIGKVCLPTEQYDPGRAPDSYFRYIDIASVDKDKKLINTAQNILGLDAPSRARKVIRTGDVLVSTVRPNLNAVAMVTDELDGEIASTGFCVLRPNPNIINGRYLFYRTQSNQFVGYLIARMKGASYPAVSDGIVKEAEIPLPTHSEQRRIVEILDQADRLRKLRAEADNKAESILRALFNKMFGDPEANPKEMDKKPLGDIIRVRSGNFLPAKNMDSEGNCPVYGGNGINGYHTEFMFKERTITIGRVGAYCGVVHFTESHCWVTDNALYVAEKKQKLEDEYLTFALQYANLNRYAGQAGQPLISANRIYPVEILIPNEREQKIFALAYRDLEKLALVRTRSKEELVRTFNLLLQRAFSGDLTTTWREAHMKELLAEMEQQAKYLN